MEEMTSLSHSTGSSEQLVQPQIQQTSSDALAPVANDVLKQKPESPVMTRKHTAFRLTRQKSMVDLTNYQKRNEQPTRIPDIRTPPRKKINRGEQKPLTLSQKEQLKKMLDKH